MENGGSAQRQPIFSRTPEQCTIKEELRMLPRRGESPGEEYVQRAAHTAINRFPGYKKTRSFQFRADFKPGRAMVMTPPKNSGKNRVNCAATIREQ